MHARIGCVILAVAFVAAAEATPVPACLEQVAKPVYLPLAVQARVVGLVRVDFRINAEGQIVDSRILEGHPILVPAVAELLRAAKVDPVSCGGKEFSVTYEFALEEPVSGLGSGTSYSFRDPNVFLVRKRFEPMTVISCPQGEITIQYPWYRRLRNLFR